MEGRPEVWNEGAANEVQIDLVAGAEEYKWEQNDNEQGDDLSL